MTLNLPSGVKMFESSDVVTKEIFNNNWAVLDRHILRNAGYGTTVNSGNAYGVSLEPASPDLIEGMAAIVKINVDNTGPATINVNGLGVKSIKKGNGSDLAAGNLKAGSIYTLRYNGSNFILQGEGGSGTAQPNNVLAGQTFSNNQGDHSGTMINQGALTLSPSGSNVVLIPEGYHNGQGKVNKVTVPAANVLAGTTIAGVTGTIPVRTGIQPPKQQSALWGDGDMAVYLNTGYYDAEIRVPKSHLTALGKYGTGDTVPISKTGRAPFIKMFHGTSTTSRGASSGVTSNGYVYCISEYRLGIFNPDGILTTVGLPNNIATNICVIRDSMFFVESDMASQYRENSRVLYKQLDMYVQTMSTDGNYLYVFGSYGGQRVFAKFNENFDLIWRSAPVEGISGNSFTLSTDPVSGQSYFTATDGFTSGKVYIITPTGLVYTVVGQFPSNGIFNLTTLSYDSFFIKGALYKVTGLTAHIVWSSSYFDNPAIRDIEGSLIIFTSPGYMKKFRVSDGVELSSWAVPGISYPMINLQTGVVTVNSFNTSSIWSIACIHASGIKLND
ncbi:hypothetical protein [Paenibacillus gorillae]|uniref:hypothetical protein n=1 Tax=Paenibacillus gorillae TaxID=1243662 RepID=UPI0004AE4FD2|nr:hypothetical protein [Paenibacillus gorillae]